MFESELHKKPIRQRLIEISRFVVASPKLAVQTVRKLPFGTREDLKRALKRLVIPFILANISYIIVLWGLALGFGKGWLQIEPTEAGNWRYQVEQGDMRVSFLDSRRPTEPISEFAYGDSSVEMVLLNSDYEVAPVRLAEAVAPRPFMKRIELDMKGVLAGTHVEYRVKEGMLKEDLVLARREAVKADPVLKYNYALILKNALPSRSTDGQYDTVFYNPKNSQYAFHIPLLEMVDAKGRQSMNIVSELRPSTAIDSWYRADLPPESQWLLTITPSTDWLLDERRAYPVKVDPTITHDDEADFTGEGSSFDGVEFSTQIGDADDTLHLSDTNDYQTDSVTVLLLAMDAANNSTAFTDSSDYTHTVNNIGGTVHTTAKARFGPTSGYFDGTDDHLSVPDSTQFTLGSGDFTIDGWVYPETLTGDHQIINHWNTGNNFASWAVHQDGANLYFWASSDGTSWDVANAMSCGTLTGERWQHFAVVRDGDTITCYVDGVVGGALTTSATLFDSAGPILVGHNDNGTNRYQGWLDQLRVSKGVARWDATFTPSAPVVEGTYTSPIIDSGGADTQWDTINWTEVGVSTGDAETPATTSGLVAQWDFNETSGTTAAVSAGSCGTACNGTLISFSDTSGQDAAVGSGWTNDNKRWGDGALMFDGTNDYVDAGTNASLKPTTAMSLEAWVRADVVNSSYAHIVSFGRDSSASGYNLFLRPDGRVALEINTDDVADGAEVNATSSADVFNVGGWYYIVATYDTTDGARLYVNGQLVASDAADGEIFYRAGEGTNFKVGEMSYDNSGANHYFQFDGSIDVVRLYNSVLTPAQVAANHQPGDIQVLTRTGDSDDPTDGTWEEWRPIAGAETSILTFDDDQTNWSWDSASSDAPLAKEDESFIKVEGTGTMELRVGQPQADASTDALWHMDETSGTGAFLKDSSGNNRDLSHSSTLTTSVVGQSDRARNWTGSSSHLTTSVFSTATQDMTVDFWVKWDDADGSASGNLFYNGDGGSVGYGLRLGDGSGGSGNEVGLYLDGVAWDAFTSTYTLPTNRWVHLAMQRDGTTWKLFANGVEVISGGTTSPGGAPSGNFTVGNSAFEGAIDELRFSNTVRSADWIAEQYRLGRDFNLTRTISALDLTSMDELSFWIASDRRGTFLEAQIGESDYANWNDDTNTTTLLRMEEIAGTGAYLNDTGGSGNDATPTGTTVVDGHDGQARSFNGTSDYMTLSNTTAYDSANISVEAWVKLDDTNGWQGIVTKRSASDPHIQWSLQTRDDQDNWAWMVGISGTSYWASGGSLSTDWTHLVGTYDGDTARLYQNGVLVAENTSPSGDITAISGLPVRVGARSTGTASPYAGQDDHASATIDSVRISDTARSAASIRQAYEADTRTHQVTVDFAAVLDSGDLIDDANDLTFKVDGTQYGMTQKASDLYSDDIIIIREKVDGTIYTAQARVATADASSGQVTITAWTVGSTFPSGGFSASASAFKWQRVYWNIGNIMTGSGTGDSANQKDGITKVTFRQIDSLMGRTIILDDMRSVSGYLTDPDATDNITSSDGQYLQYQIVYTGGFGGSGGSSGVSDGDDSPTDPPAIDDVEITYTETITVTASHAPTPVAFTYESITLTGEASVASGITQIELYLDGTDPGDLVHTCYYSPASSATCSHVYGPLSSGSHTLTAKAYSATDNATGETTFNITGFTVSNSVSVSRSKVDVDTDFTLNFGLTSSSTGTLTVTFPASFTMLSAPTAGASSACLSGFTFNDTLHQLTATKTNCIGSIVLGGATIHTPSQSGVYTVTWSNDNGEAVLFITDDDEVSVTSNIDPTLTFDLDVSIADGESSAPYVVDLGALSSAAPKGSDNSLVDSIWINLATNATGGATVSVQSLYQALRSTSSPSDEITSATETLIGNDEGYGLCVASATGTQAGGDTFTAQGNYAGTCDGATFVVGELNATATNLLVTSGPIDSGRSQVRVGASASASTPAHPDYNDVLIFLATATY